MTDDPRSNRRKRGHESRFLFEEELLEHQLRDVVPATTDDQFRDLLPRVARLERKALLVWFKTFQSPLMLAGCVQWRAASLKAERDTLDNVCSMYLHSIEKDKFGKNWAKKFLELPEKEQTLVRARGYFYSAAFHRLLRHKSRRRITRLSDECLLLDHLTPPVSEELEIQELFALAKDVCRPPDAWEAWVKPHLLGDMTFEQAAALYKVTPNAMRYRYIEWMRRLAKAIPEWAGDESF